MILIIIYKNIIFGYIIINIIAVFNTSRKVIKVKEVICLGGIFSILANHIQPVAIFNFELPPINIK